MPIKKCAVVGAGFIGSNIARFMSQHGIKVLLKDRTPALTKRGLRLTIIEGQHPYRWLS